MRQALSDWATRQTDLPPGEALAVGPIEATQSNVANTTNFIRPSTQFLHRFCRLLSQIAPIRQRRAHFSGLRLGGSWIHDLADLGKLRHGEYGANRSLARVAVEIAGAEALVA
jgi:hypothetical protein